MNGQPENISRKIPNPLHQDLRLGNNEIQTHETRLSFLKRPFVSALNRWQNMASVDRLYVTHLGIFLGLQAADLLTTYTGLRIPNFSEGNEIGSQIIDQTGFTGAVFFKAAVTGLFVACNEYVLHRLSPNNKHITTLKISNGLLACIVSLNTAQILVETV